MAIFTSYVPPNVYVDTFTDISNPIVLAGLRVPAFIGVGAETLPLDNFEIIRGSSAVSDIRMIGEDASTQVTGLNRTFETKYWPVVDGSGTASTSNDPNVMSVLVNGEPTSVIQLDGSTGTFTLGTIPELGATLEISYFFARTDTKITDDDLSEQADGVNKVFKVDNVRIVAGNNGGITTTDPSLVKVTVNGVAANVTAVDGELGLITLTSAPASNTVVLATYYTNTWQDTYDFLPQNIEISKVRAVGNAPGRQDYFQGTDFVIEAGNKIQWGSSFAINKATVNTGNALDGTQVSATLADNRFYMRELSGLVDGSNKSYVLEELPTSGTGLDFVIDDTSLVQVYVGATVQAALTAGPVVTTSLEGLTKTVVLKNAPSGGNKVFASFYYNLLVDDTFTVKNKIATVGLTPGQYEITSGNFGQMYDAAFSIPDCLVAAPQFSTELISFPGDVEDTQTIPGFSVEEDVSLTFVDASTFVVSSSLLTDGSNGTGYLNQTYLDEATGLRFTVMAPTTFSYQAGDILVLKTNKRFLTGTGPKRAIPGLRLVVSDTTNIGVDNTCEVNTYNKSGSEPTVGDTYYISLDYTKTNFSQKLFDDFKDVVGAFGELNIENRLTLAANLAFLNGAPALALLQVPKDSGGLQASDSSFINMINTLESPLDGGVSPNYLVCLTTSPSVIQYMKKHVDKVSTSRYAQERTGMFGFAIGTTPESAQNFVKAIKDERMLAVYPDGAIITLQDALGRDVDSTVDGSFLAAAIAGLAANQGYDVATPLTRKSMVGFKRLFRPLDAVQMNQSATAGITILTQNSSAIQVRHAVTTDPSNVLTREPTVVFIKDEVQRQTRSTLDPFIAEKFLSSRLTDIEIALTNMFKALRQAQIIVAFKDITAVPDDNDPTVAIVTGYYSPVFPLNWIKVNYTLRTKLS